MTHVDRDCNKRRPGVTTMPQFVVEIDPVNFEKPYTHELAGVSTVHKSSPPDRHGQARLVGAIRP
jgi:hypothetical protein